MSATAGDRLTRLLTLVPWLLTHDGVTIGECAEHFGVSAEQLERDLWLLVVCGVPGYGPDQLVDIDFWNDGVIHVIDPQTLGRPLHLTHEEALSLLIALRMLAQLPGIVDRQAIVTAAAKIEQVASDSASERFVAVQVGVPPEVTAAVDNSLSQGLDLKLRYASATRDEVTDRTVQPRRLHIIDGVAYLEAYCLSAEAVRTFRLDRVISAEVGGPSDVAVESVESPVTSLASVAILIVGPSARWIADVHHGRLLSESADGSARIELPLHSLEWAVHLVLSLRGAAIVEGPADLASAVAQEAQSALGSYP
ncbi:MAG: WYL domain-containing protein [Actinobacteria bacterium]|nr:WYL domain-containing protein [Actinomycetota bacterium]